MRFHLEFTNLTELSSEESVPVLVFTVHWSCSGVGVQWSNFDRAVTIDEDWSLLYSMMMMLIDCVLYGVIAWYIDNVFPGDYGLPQPAYFFLTVSIYRSCD